MRDEIVKACGCPMDRADDVRFEMMSSGLDFSECSKGEFAREARAAWSRLEEPEDYSLRDHCRDE